MSKQQSVRRALIQMGKAAGLTGAALLAFVNQAYAALPPEATSAFTTLSDNVADIFVAIWPIVAAVTGGFVLIKLFKKGANKAA